MSEKRIMKKVCVIGEAAVGKTSLIKRFVIDRFNDRYIATIGTKTSAQEIEIFTGSENVNICLQIWDIIGLRSFAKLQTRAYNGADGAFIVTDISRKGTLQSFKLWLLALYKITGEIPVIMIANKNDLDHDFNEAEIEREITGYDIPYFITSAKTGINVEDAFNKLGELMVNPLVKKNIIPQLEEATAHIVDVEPELEPGRAYSIFEVEDIIMARYCDLLNDPYLAMHLINEKFTLAIGKYHDPSIERLNWIVDNLIEAASHRIEPERLNREQKVYSELIQKIG